MNITSVSVIGGGAWGTALAQTLAHGGKRVTLWAREDTVIDDVNSRHVNRTFLPGIELEGSIAATGSLAEAAKSDALLMVVPAQHVRSVSQELARSIA